MESLTKQQQRIVESNDPHLLILAAASSGKTRILTERTRHLIRSGVAPSEIVVITFTNAAASVLKRRLGNDYSDELHISTVHSYANYLLRINGIQTTDIIEEEEFDKLFKEIFSNDITFNHIAHLLVDEAQDSSSLHFQFFEALQPDNFFFVGDIRQSIFGFAGARPDILQKIARDPNVQVHYLNENFRNRSNILTYAKGLIKKANLNDDSHAMRSGGLVYEIMYDEDKIVSLIKESSDDYGDWFILTRTNQQSAEIMWRLQKANIPHETFKKADLTREEMVERLQANTVKVLTIHTAKGTENKNVIVVGSRYYDEEENRVNYVAATRARDLLIWTRHPKKKGYRKF